MNYELMPYLKLMEFVELDTMHLQYFLTNIRQHELNYIIEVQVHYNNN